MEEVTQTYGKEDDIMSDSIRILVESMYPGKKWQEKVAKMSDTQVCAIYYRRQKERGKKKNGKNNQGS